MIKKLNEKREQKGFTLVELLVVIAILAVLATVSVVGYTSFINKANNSNALTECKQAEEIILSDLISATGEADGEKKCGNVTFSYDSDLGRISFTGSETKDVLTLAMKEKFKDMSQLEGSFECNDGVITYTTSNGKGTATWKSGEVPKAVEVNSTTETTPEEEGGGATE